MGTISFSASSWNRNTLRLSFALLRNGYLTPGCSATNLAFGQHSATLLRFGHIHMHFNFMQDDITFTLGRTLNETHPKDIVPITQ